MISYSGLTWDHPRGYKALAAAAERPEAAGQFSLRWQTQPLEGFEEHPIAELCAVFDLVVLDHPHIGEAVRSGCLQPLDAVFRPKELKAIASRTIGRCFDSYHYASRQWALPLDGATQVMAYRKDLIDSKAPETWDEVVALSRSTSVTLSTAGPHAALTLMSIAVAGGVQPALDGRFLPTDVGLAALDIMDQIHSRAPIQTRTLNPIGILELMAGTNTIVLCPLVYGYVNYASPATNGRHGIHFADAPRVMQNTVAGSILGGTGISITRRCHITSELVDHLLWLISEEAQMFFIPAHSGQPSARRAWYDANVNKFASDFYAGTASTIETAHVRPRFDGYVAFQTLASALVRDGLEQRRVHADILRDIEHAYGALHHSNEER